MSGGWKLGGSNDSPSGTSSIIVNVQPNSPEIAATSSRMNIKIWIWQPLSQRTKDPDVAALCVLLEDENIPVFPNVCIYSIDGMVSILCR